MAFPEGGDFSARFSSGYGGVSGYSALSPDLPQDFRIFPDQEIRRVMQELDFPGVLQSLQETWEEKMDLTPFEDAHIDYNRIHTRIRGLRMQAGVPYLSFNTGAKDPSDFAAVLNMADGKTSTSLGLVPTGTRSLNICLIDSGFLRDPSLELEESVEKFKTHGLQVGLSIVLMNQFHQDADYRYTPYGIKKGEDTVGTTELFANIIQEAKNKRVKTKNTPRQIRERTFGLARLLGINTDDEVSDGCIAVTVEQLEDHFNLPWTV